MGTTKQGKRLPPGIIERVYPTGRKVYRVEVRIKGYAPQVKTFDRLQDAKYWQDTTKAVIREERLRPDVVAQSRTVADLIDRYIDEVLPNRPKSARDTERELFWWKAQLGDVALPDVAATMLTQARDDLARGLTPRGQVRTPATVNRYLAALSTAFTAAVKDWGWMDANPMVKVRKQREPRGRTRFLTDSERAQLLEAAKRQNPAMYPVAVLLIYTGCRLSEIMGLRWEQVDIEHRHLVLREGTTKNSEPRYVPLAAPALGAIRDWTNHHRLLGVDLLFPSTIDTCKPLDLKRAWDACIRETGLQGVTRHTLRHTAASYLIMSGASLADVAAILGHKSLQMTMRYSHLLNAHKQEIVDRMAEKFPSK